MKLSDFDYNLPKKLIAQYPLPERDSSRLLVLDREKGDVTHDVFSNFPYYLDKSDLLLLNNTRVFPAKLTGTKKNSGGKVELLLIREIEPALWKAMIKSSGKIKENMEISFDLDNISAVTLKKDKKNNKQTESDYSGGWLIQFNSEKKVKDLLDNKGMVPLPPYIKRDNKMDSHLMDHERYQTVYASKRGAIAAPTAGLHFTKTVLDKINEKGVEIAEVTLHVSTGTFKPVRSNNIQNHLMDPEYFEISKTAESAIRKAIREKRRIIAVGTTTVRTIESMRLKEDTSKPYKGPYEGFTNIFIYPGYKFRAVSSLLTNFHLPKSTLLMLVCAFAGTGNVRKAYTEAIKENYRFYSYGDAMLIL